MTKDHYPEGFLYVPELISTADQSRILEELQALEYHHDTFRGRQLKRGYAQFGFSYVTTGRKLEPAPEFPVFLRDFLTLANPQCPGHTFNQCIVTYYPKSAGIGWHTDAPVFGDCIMGASFGNQARFQLRQKDSDEIHEFAIVPGSLYCMQGTVRWDYQHQIVPVKLDRYSVTFRQVQEG